MDSIMPEWSQNNIPQLVVILLITTENNLISSLSVSIWIKTHIYSNSLTKKNAYIILFISLKRINQGHNHEHWLDQFYFLFKIKYLYWFRGIKKNKEL